MYCKNCGKESSSSAQFCPYCGTPYGNVGNAVPPSYQQQNFSQQNQGYYEQPAQQYQQPYGFNTAYTVQKKNSKAPIALIIAIVIVVVFGLFMILEATGVTEITGWFDNGSSVSETDNEDKDKADEKVAEDEEFDETITTDNKKTHEYDKYTETRTSDDDGDSEFSYSDNSYSSSNSSSSSGGATAVADYVSRNNGYYSTTFSNDSIASFLEARGTSLVCVCQYKTDAPSNAADSLADYLSLDTTANTFKSSLAQMKVEEPAITSLIVEYRNKNGVLLASREYR